MRGVPRRRPLPAWVSQPQVGHARSHQLQHTHSGPQAKRPGGKGSAACEAPRGHECAARPAARGTACKQASATSLPVPGSGRNVGLRHEPPSTAAVRCYYGDGGQQEAKARDCATQGRRTALRYRLLFMKLSRDWSRATSSSSEDLTRLMPRRPKGTPPAGRLPGRNAADGPGEPPPRGPAPLAWGAPMGAAGPTPGPACGRAWTAAPPALAGTPGTPRPPEAIPGMETGAAPGRGRGAAPGHAPAGGRMPGALWPEACGDAPRCARAGIEAISASRAERPRSIHRTRADGGKLGTERGA